MLDAVNCAKPSHRLAASITLTYPANWPARKYLFPRVRDFGTIFVKRCPPVVGLTCYELISTHLS